MNALIVAMVMPLLAETGPFAVFVSVIFVLVVVAALIGLVAVARKRLFHGQAADDAGFSLGSLRDLVRQGKMTPEEYDRLKGQVIAAAQRKAEREAMEVKPDHFRPPPGPAADDDSTGLV